ncbi:MAG: AzlD domain-containing protein [Methylobacteriaceae bacterium]|nr:AzlD domain-containing protein [Methylobacteriaceae bacterium]
MAELGPYLIIVLAGVIPNEASRIAAVLLSHRVDERSEVFAWIRLTATTLLAAVVSRLVYAPAAALAVVPMPVRVGAIAIGVAAFYLARRRLLVAILVGEGAFVLGAWLFSAR